MLVQQRFDSLQAIIAFNRAKGYQFFEPATMSWFRSRAYPELYPAAVGHPFIVTSEQGKFCGELYSRKYTVRKLRPDGTFDTIGEFQEHDTLRQARRAAERASERDLAENDTADDGLSTRHYPNVEGDDPGSALDYFKGEGGAS